MSAVRMLVAMFAVTVAGARPVALFPHPPGNRGGPPHSLKKPPSEGPIGQGASGVWIYRPAGEPKDLVVFLHGQGGPEEARPDNHLPWINHLVSRGSELGVADVVESHLAARCGEDLGDPGPHQPGAHHRYLSWPSDCLSDCHRRSSPHTG